MKRGSAALVLVGATVGASMAYVVRPSYAGEPPSFAERLAYRLLLAAYVAPVFGMVGAAVGGLIKREGWAPVQGWPLSGTTPGLLLGMHTMPDGSAALALGMELRF